jgi:anti-sigma-K factor RskA
MAAVLAIVALGAWNVRLQSQLQDAAAYRDGVVAVFDTAAAPGGRLAVLTTPADGSAAGIAALGADGRVALALRNLDPTTGGEVYQAWLIGSTGAPVPVGSFSVGESGSGILSATAAATDVQVIALTREPGPGATTPTLPILVQGQVEVSPG